MIDLDALRENWPWLAFAIGGLVGIGKTATTASGARASASKAHERINKTQEDLTAVRECVARMETHYEHTMKAVDQINKEIRREGGPKS